MVHQVLHKDLNFHPYKMVMFQAISDQDTVNRKTLCEVMLNALDNNSLNHIPWRMKEIFIFLAVLKTVTTGQPVTLAIFTRNLYVLRRLLFGVV